MTRRRPDLQAWRRSQSSQDPLDMLGLMIAAFICTCYVVAVARFSHFVVRFALRPEDLRLDFACLLLNEVLGC